MKIGFYSGSFDPFTNGHLHVVKSACQIFDKVIVGIGINANKTRNYNIEDMKLAIEQTMMAEGITNVEVITYDELTVEVAQKYNANFLIRGLRNDTDYAFEENLAQINEEISGLDTIYFRSGVLGFISSSMVMELLHYDRDVSRYLPEPIFNLVNSVSKNDAIKKIF